MSAPGPLDLLGSWRLDTGVVATIVVSAVAYAGAVRSLHRGGAGWPVGRTVAFAGGLAAVALALQSGLETYGDRLLSVHMASHLVLMLLAAPLLLLGRPLELALRVLHGARRRALAAVLHRPAWRALTHPVTGIAVLALAMVATHLTGLYDLALRDRGVHAAEHAAYLWSALVFWAVVIPPAPRPHAPRALARVAYLLASMPAMTAVAAVLEADAAPRYPTYVARSRALGVDALADQHVAAALMWAGGSLAIGAAVLLVAWRAMGAEERRALRREALAEHPRRASAGGIP